jgi:hypothetical protein
MGEGVESFQLGDLLGDRAHVRAAADRHGRRDGVEFTSLEEIG